MKDDLEQFETQAAETLGAMKDLYAEFEKRLGEVVGMQRLAASEARNEGAKVRTTLEKIARSAQETADSQRQAVAELRAGWNMHVAENSKAAGAEMANTFGKAIASGLQQRLEQLATRVEGATMRFEWKTSLKWGLGGAAIALTALALMTSVLVKVIEPEAVGLGVRQAHEAMAHVAPCTIGKESHICVAVDPDKYFRDPHGATFVAISGM